MVPHDPRMPARRRRYGGCTGEKPALRVGRAGGDAGADRRDQKLIRS